MVIIKACKLNLPHTSRPSLDITSLLFEPSSNTLALMQSDSSILLLPSLSPFSPPSPFPLIQPQTLIPPLTTSYTFIRLQSTPNSPNSRVLFVAAGPKESKESKILLRFWILSRNRKLFVKSKIICSNDQKGILVDEKLGVLVDVNHGNSLKLIGNVNVLGLYSVSEGKIWVFGVKIVGDEEESVCVKLMKSVVVECSVPVYSITVSMGFLVLGESNGVRVIPLRGIMKGRVDKEREFAKRKGKKIVLRDCECEENGGCRVVSGREDKGCVYVGKVKCVENDNGRKSIELRECVENSLNRYVGKVEMNGVKSQSKLRSVKLKQDSNVGETLFVPFNSLEAPCEESSTKLLLSLRAVSIHSLSKKMFLVLDSDGDLHLLGLYRTSPGSDFTGHMKHLSCTMKVQMLAVLPDTSTRAQTIWVSDGVNTVHVLSLSDMEVPPSENKKIESMEMLMQMQLSATEAVFASEKVQNLAPLSANAVLVLGQGTIFAYAIS